MGKADDADGAGPQAHHRHKQHEEVQPALVGERNSEDLAPETVGGDHRIGLFFLGGFERLERVRLFAILKQGVFHGSTVNRTEQCTAKNARHTKGGSKEPAALSQGVHQEDTDEHRNRTGEGDGVVRTNADQTSNFELTQHEADQCEGTVESNESPEASELAPADKVTLGFWAPEQEKAVTHRISGGGHSSSQKVATLEVGRRNAVGVPGSYKGGSRYPATNREVGRGKKENAGPADKHKSVAFEPVIEDVEPSPLRHATCSDRHELNGAVNPHALGSPC